MGEKYSYRIFFFNFYPNGQQTLGAPRTASYYDQLGRVVREETLNLNVFSTKVDTEYNNEGRIHRVSEPFTDNPQYWTVYSHYDALNRPGLVEPAAGGRIVNQYGIDYSGIGRHQHRRILTVADFNASGDNITERSTIYNSLGQVVQVTDPDNTPVTYSYNVQGNLKTTTVNHNSATTITLTYNIAGLRDSIDDPDAGHIRFEYDALGQLRRQTWAPDTPQAKSQTLNYDLLGRQLARVDVDEHNNSHTQQWHYDNRWLGALDRREGNGLSEERYFYPAGHQNAGQLSHIETTLDDANTRRFDYAYDAYGRPHTETTPGQLTIERSYHAAGFHCGTTDISDPNNPQVIWLIGNENDSRGNIVDQLYGNGIQTRQVYDPQRGHLIGIRSGQVGNQIDTTGTFAATAQSLHYTYDSLGNLTQRRSQREDVNGTPLEWLSENFRYDNLNRLTNTDLYHDASLTRQESYNYDALGNLISKSDIGTLAYNQTNGAGVHAVTQANGQSYHYDTYGNMIQRGSDTVDYDVFNKPTRIDNHHFTYGPDRARYKQVGPTGTTYYIGNYEEVITTAGTEQRTTIDGFYLHTRQVSSGTITTTYLHQDHLGSNEAMTDSSGDYIQRMRFNAWGERQQADGNMGDPTGGNPLHYPTTRGYTGHEMLDGLSLVHMNGRVYDPVLGRFMTADILVQAPYNTQSYNRYSYVLNNPLSRIDPSGYKSDGLSDGDNQHVNEQSKQGENEQLYTIEFESGESFTGTKAEINKEYEFQVTVTTKGGKKETVTNVGLDGAGVSMALARVSQGRLGLKVNAKGHMIVCIGARACSSSSNVSNMTNGQIVGGLASTAANGNLFGKFLKGVKGFFGGFKRNESEAPGLCFSVGTLVDTPNGKIRIEELQVGDEVWAYDFESGGKVKRQITAVNRGFTEYWVNIKTHLGDEVKATRFHKFWVESETRWVDAIDLRSGMSFRLKNGEVSLVESVSVAYLASFEDTYNFEVEVEHNYFVGDTGILVHNGHPEILGTELANKNAHESAQIIQREQAKRARSAIGPKTGIKRIDIPVGDTTKPGNFPHAHGVDKSGKPWSLNIDGSVHDAEKSTGTASKKAKDALRKAGWGC